MVYQPDLVAMGKTKPGWTSIKSTADKVKFVNVENSFINNKKKLLQMPQSLNGN